MSTPRGKRIQRELAKLARSILEPLGCSCEVDFKTRGGHQKLRVTLPGSDQPSVSLDLVSTPRDEGFALEAMKRRCWKIVSQYNLA